MTDKKETIAAEEISEEKAVVAIGGSEAAAMLDASEEEVFTHTLSKPIKYDGETITELVFDFSSLTGGDSLAVEDELRASGHPIFVRSIDGAYLIRMCAKACTKDIDYGVFEYMPAKDYISITNKLKRFL